MAKIKYSNSELDEQINALKAEQEKGVSLAKIELANSLIDIAKNEPNNAKKMLDQISKLDEKTQSFLQKEIKALERVARQKQQGQGQDYAHH